MQDSSYVSGQRAGDRMWLRTLVRYVWYQRGIRASLAIACLLLAWNMVIALAVVLSLSLLWCPVWLFIEALALAVQLPGGRVAVLRAVAPPVVVGLVLAGGAFRMRVVEATATRIITACEAFRAASGRFPASLDELVPRYLRSVPHAGYRVFGRFRYVCGDGRPLLEWQVAPTCARKVYDFQERRRRYVD